MKRKIMALALASILAGPNMSFAKEKANIQIAILLDGSGSMQGLINQARRQIWKIVNELAKATKNDIQPNLEIAVYEYGKDQLPAEAGHLQQLVALTGDLDTVSEKLNGIEATGSREFTPMAIQAASSDLNWSVDDGDFKAIFISGNETMKQGPVDLFEAIQKSVSKGVILNTIHANTNRGLMSPDQASVAETDFWVAAAEAGLGDFLEINLNHSVPKVKTPLDDEIVSLNSDLNATYIPFGEAGLREYRKLLDADASSERDGGFFDRSVTKSGGYYNNWVVNWDLGAAAKAHEGGVRAFIEKFDREKLPEELREKSVDELVALVEDKCFEREQIQLAIQKLNSVRQAFVDREIEKLNGESLAGLDKAMIDMLRRQLKEKGFELKE